MRELYLGLNWHDNTGQMRRGEDVDIIPHRGINAEVGRIELRGQGQNDLIACLCARLRVSQIPHVPPVHCSEIPQ